jgi:hypothetical protein
MRPRFQPDADFNGRRVHGLWRREPAWDILSAQQGGVIGPPDREVLRVAARAGRILVSHYRNTLPAHFRHFIQRQVSPGVIIVSQYLDMGAAIEDILLIWAVTVADEWVNELGFLPV